MAANFSSTPAYVSVVTWHVCSNIFTSRVDDDVALLSRHVCFVRKLVTWYVCADNFTSQERWWCGTSSRHICFARELMTWHVVVTTLLYEKDDDVARCATYLLHERGDGVAYFCHNILTSQGRWWCGTVFATSLLHENGGTTSLPQESFFLSFFFF